MTVIETTRFGPVEVDETRLICFADGPVGFPAHKRFALISVGPQSSFYWLQSADDPGLAFVVTDPRLFVPDYAVPLREEDAQRLGAASSDLLQLFVIVNKVDGVLTGNLQGPIVVNPTNLHATQLVMSERRFTTRHPLIQLPARKEVLSRSA
ncbi:MAG: flagellar assembly protein FliW [Phycisphaerae bacterium]|nr:flagellar assembly protein FliW [Phycisphaerae bacterium]